MKQVFVPMFLKPFSTHGLQQISWEKKKKKIQSGVSSHLFVYTQQFLHVSDGSYGWVHAGDVIGATSTAAETSLYN